MSEKIQINFQRPAQGYEISVDNGNLNHCGDWLRQCVSPVAQKIVVVSNRKVFGLYGEKVTGDLKKRGFEVFVYLIGDGERYKSFQVLEKTLKFFSENKLKRSDAVIALGGGVVGDLTGFAASVYLRGVDFLQVPTTFLSMIDSSVGGKTAVNSDFGKNLIGSFYQPRGVLIDVSVLQTLPRRELTAGFCEAVKQGALDGRKLFDDVADFLQTYPVNSFRKHFSDAVFLEKLQKIVAAQIDFKARIVAGDELENIDRTDANSRKILNFGHTVAHALEKITDYKYFKHGEAVGLGILTAAEISKVVANFGQDELNLLNDVVRLTGNLPSTANIEASRVIKAFAFDKKQTGNSLQWILLNSIGNPVIFQNAKIPESVVKNSVKKIFGK